MSLKKLQNCGNTQKQSVSGSFQKLVTNLSNYQKKSDSFLQSICMFWVVENYQIESDTSLSAQTNSRLSELQSCFRHFQRIGP